MCGFIFQLVEHCAGIAGVTGSGKGKTNSKFLVWENPYRGYLGITPGSRKNFLGVNFCFGRRMKRLFGASSVGFGKSKRACWG